MTSMSILILAVVFFIFFGIYQHRNRPTMLCKRCGHVGPARNTTRGSLGIEILLWLLFIIPGILYSLWRLTTRQPGCEKCGSNDLIPPDSPIATQMLQR